MKGKILVSTNHFSDLARIFLIIMTSALKIIQLAKTSDSSSDHDPPQTVYRVGTRLNLKSTTLSLLSGFVEIIAHVRLGLARRTQVVVVKLMDDMRTVDPNLAA